MFELKKIYKRIIIYAACLLITCSVLLIVKNIMVKNQVLSKYILDGAMNYSIESKEGSVVGDDLDKQDLFVSSTINNIIVDFNYKFTFDKRIDYKYRYQIKTYVVSELDDSSITEKEVYRKEQVLFDSGYENGVTDSFEINKKVSLNYDYYNSIAENFNYSVNIPVDSKLIAQLIISVQTKNLEEKEYKYNMYIPLEENTFSITDNNKSYKEEFLDEENYSIKLFLNFIIFIACITFIIFIIIEVLKLFKYKKEHYLEFKYRKIMSDYENIIAPINALPKDKDIVSIKVLYFKNMIDIQKELHLPILCYKSEKFIVYLIISNKLAYIYFLNNNREKI